MLSTPKNTLFTTYTFGRHTKPQIYAFSTYTFGSIMVSASKGEYRYGFNGKETDNETGLQDYGFRIYNPSFGKFLSVDPLSRDYPWNSTYAFAENRVIDGIDLEGREYLNFNDSRVDVYYGRVRIKLQNFSYPYQNQFQNNYPLHGLDYYDPLVINNRLVGTYLRANPKDILIFGNQNEINAYTNKGTSIPKTPDPPPIPQPNSKSEEPTAPTPGGTRAAAGTIAAVNVINFGIQSSIGLLIKNDNEKLKKDVKAFESALSDLQTALEKGIVPLKYQNTQDLSQILNVILQGQTISGNQDLYQIGLNITEKISKNIKLEIIDIKVLPSGVHIVNYKPVEEMRDPALKSQSNSNDETQSSNSK